MAPSKDDHRTWNHLRVSPNEDLPSLAASKMATAPEDGVQVDRLENRLYSVVEVLEEAILSHSTLRTEILPQQLLKVHRFCEKLRKSLVEMRAATQRNTMDPQCENTTGLSRSFDRLVEGDSCASRLTSAQKYVAMYEDSMKAQIHQFVNWHHLWQENLIQDLQTHSQETSRKLMSLIEEAAPEASQIAASLWDDRQPNYDACAAAPHLDEFGAIARWMQEGHRESFAADRTLRHSEEPEVFDVSVASIGSVSAQQLRARKMGSASAKIQQILSTLQRKPSFSVSTAPEALSSPAAATPLSVQTALEVQSLRAEAAQQVDELWRSIETHRVKALPHSRLGEYMRNLVHLSLVVADKELFYEYVLFCALQLRNPANVDELAVVTGAVGAGVAAPTIDWSTYRSSRCQHLVLLSSAEKRFFVDVTKLSAASLVVWCSAYACLLLRLADRGVAYVRRRLRHLNRHVADAYGLDERHLPRPPVDAPSFVDRLRSYANYAVDAQRRNTLYKGLIELYECAAPQRTKKLLNFLLLASLRYRGWSLVALVDECRTLYGVSTRRLRRNTLVDETSASWRTYELFTSTWAGLDRRHKYGEVFCPQMYAQLRFDANFHLCSLLCALIDTRKLKNGCAAPLYHKAVKRARADDDSWPRFDATWKRKCAQIAQKFIRH